MAAAGQDQLPPCHSSSFTHSPTFSAAHAAAPSAPPLDPYFLYCSSPWSLHGPVPSSLSGFAIAQSVHTAASIHADNFDSRSVRVENLHVHFHPQFPVSAIRDEYQKHVHRSNSSLSWPPPTGTPSSPPNRDHDGSNSSSSEPSFALASSAEGINFGRKFVKGYYRAVKHVDERRHLITYTQSPSAAQSLLLTLSMGLSTKRAKHVIFVFDSGPPQHLAHAWPLHIHLREIVGLIQSLGTSFEYTRAKVKKNRFSLYIFGIKQRGARFSSQGMQTWSAICYWAHNLPHSADNETISSFLSSLGSSQGESL